MSEDLNPQLEQMAHESMVRNLAHQADAIWPQERELLLRDPLPEPGAILDAGCGTGEITFRLAELFPRATVHAVDILEEHVERARQRCAPFGDRVQVTRGDVFALEFPAETFDLVVNRHVLQAIPHPDRVIAELARVAKPGGILHLLVEDYGMIHMAPTRLDADVFWHEGPRTFGGATGTDLHVGRKAFSILNDLGLAGITVDYVVVDTIRVPRETFAAIWEAWRDGYVDAIAEHTRFDRAETIAYFEDMIACIRNPRGYAVWHVPIVRARKPKVA
jgi:ubiquinone/menaquinone biosynthesis C-methylase UbiE